MSRAGFPSTIAVLVIVFVGLFWLINPFPSLPSAFPQKNMAVKHLVLFQFKADAAAEAVQEVCQLPRDGRFTAPDRAER